MKLSKTLLIGAAIAVSSVQSHTLSTANAADVIFGGAVTSSCVLTVGVPGILGTSSDKKVLSSKIAGGARGTVAAVATGSGFSVTTTAPTSFTSAPGAGGSNVDFASEYEITGATNSGVQQDGTNTELNPGVSTIGVDLTATKTVGIFEAGVYAAATTVTCE